jgi:hypothetical protein
MNTGPKNRVSKAVTKTVVFCFDRIPLFSKHFQRNLADAIVHIKNRAKNLQQSFQIVKIHRLGHSAPPGQNAPKNVPRKHTSISESVFKEIMKWRRRAW